MNSNRIVIGDALLTAFSAFLFLWFIVASRPMSPQQPQGRPPDNKLFLATVQQLANDIPLDISSCFGCALISKDDELLGWWCSVPSGETPGVVWPVSPVTMSQGEALVIELDDSPRIESAHMYFFLTRIPTTNPAAKRDTLRAEVTFQVQDGVSNAVKFTLDSQNQFISGVSVSAARRGQKVPSKQIEWMSLINPNLSINLGDALHGDIHPDRLVCFPANEFSQSFDNSVPYYTHHYDSPTHRIIMSGQGSNPPMTGLRIFLNSENEIRLSPATHQLLSQLFSQQSISKIKTFDSPVYLGSRGLSVLATMKKDRSQFVLFLDGNWPDTIQQFPVQKNSQPDSLMGVVDSDVFLKLVARRFSENGDILNQPVFFQHPELWLPSMSQP